MKHKILTYHFDAGDGEVIFKDLQTGLAYMMPNTKFLNDLPQDETIDLSISVKRIMTEEEYNELPEHH